MEPDTQRKLISRSFNKLHEQVSVLRALVEGIDDPEASEFLDAMEFGLFAPMRRLRMHLDIPYDWRDLKDASDKEAVA
ncbi:MAG: hypothetical protein LDL33_11820 [Desulfomonile sp.]|nr:hypothetical protein [Desulfomonile sp.]